MFKSSRRATRTSVKLNMVAEEIRRQIVQGELGPTDILPTRTELQERFNVSRVTVQRALDRLMEDGFVEATPGMGTFVTQRPPHLYRFGLVFGYRPSDSQPWLPFWNSLRDAAAEVDSSGEYDTTTFFADRGDIDSPDYATLERDVESHTVAGLIFAGAPSGLNGLPPLTEKGIPRIAIHDGPVPEEIDIRIRLGARSFIDKALDWLQQRNRKRIALITDALGGVSCPFTTYFQEQAAARGMSTHSHWVQAVRINDAQWAHNVACLLMQGTGEARPDALIVARDSLVEYAKGGVLASGVQVGTEMDMVVHRNLPCNTPAILPVKRIGHDIREVLRLAIDGINKLRRHEPVEKSIKLPAIYEDELPDAPRDA